MIFFVELFSFTLPKKERDVSNRSREKIFPESSFQPFPNKADIYTKILILVEVREASELQISRVASRDF